MSARILRSTSIPALPNPWTNLEYDRPCCRAPAPIRAIHRRRNCALRSRRSRYAYWPEWSSCSLATRYRFERDPKYPLAFRRTSRRFFFAWTDRLTRAMVPYFRRSRRMLVRSAVTSTRRRRLPLFFLRKWLPVALRWRTLPVRVMRNRLAVARCVFCFGIALLPLVERGVPATPLRLRGGLRGGRDHLVRRPLRNGLGSGQGDGRLRLPPVPRLGALRFGGPLRRRKDHHHVPSVLLGMRLDDGLLREVRDQPVQDLASELGAGHLAPPEHDGHLDPRARPAEPLDVALLGGVVVRIDLGTELDLLDLDPGLLLAGFLLTDVALVLELPVVHDPGHGRVRLRRHLHEIEIQILCLTERVLGRNDPDLRPVCTHQAHLRRADAVVYARISRDPASPPYR